MQALRVIDNGDGTYDVVTTDGFKMHVEASSAREAIQKVTGK